MVGLLVCELVLLVCPFFALGIYIGIELSLRVLNKEKFVRLADDSVNKAFQTASSVRNLCEDYVYAAIKSTTQFPYNPPEVRDYLARKINLN